MGFNKNPAILDGNEYDVSEYGDDSNYEPDGFEDVKDDVRAVDGGRFSLKQIDDLDENEDETAFNDDELSSMKKHVDIYGGSWKDKKIIGKIDTISEMIASLVDSTIKLQNDKNLPRGYKNMDGNTPLIILNGIVKQLRDNSEKILMSKYGIKRRDFRP
jgi:hypothetical protein